MEPPKWMTCGDCLRSFELAPDEVDRGSTSCPICNGTIERRLSARETPLDEVPLSLPVDSKEGGGDWTRTWKRGSLGTVGRFHLREQLGDDGCGVVVFQAYDPRLDRDVALKVSKEADPDDHVMQRFFREARAAARLSHPNIVRIHDAGCDDGRCWIAYAFVTGRTLARRMAQQQIDIPTAVRIIRDLADALDHAHQEGVLHLGVKPVNVILDFAGRPQLIDFGLSRRADIGSGVTGDGVILGTPGYLSSEQAKGKSERADEWSDISRLGVMMDELVCGRRPVERPDNSPSGQVKPPEVMPSPRTLNSAVPVAVEKMILKALKREGSDCYPSALAFAIDLDRWLRTRGKLGQGGFSQPLAAVLLGTAGSLLLVLLIAALFNAPLVVITKELPQASAPVVPPESASSRLPAQSIASVPTPAPVKTFPERE
jgi:eukaryotic-like serine/threonine-protein kinase